MWYVVGFAYVLIYNHAVNNGNCRAYSYKSFNLSNGSLPSDSCARVSPDQAHGGAIVSLLSTYEGHYCLRRNTALFF